MRLLHARSKRLKQFSDNSIPKYAILSHTWGDSELTFEDLERLADLPPSAKIDGCCAQTLADGLEHVWIDTICIDKSSSSELSEAINSMRRSVMRTFPMFLQVISPGLVILHFAKVDGSLGDGRSKSF